MHMTSPDDVRQTRIDTGLTQAQTEYIADKVQRQHPNGYIESANGLYLAY